MYKEYISHALHSDFGSTSRKMVRNCSAIKSFHKWEKMNDFQQGNSKTEAYKVATFTIYL